MPRGLRSGLVVNQEHRVQQDEERPDTILSHRRKGSVDLAGTLCPQGLKSHPQCQRGDLRFSQLGRVGEIGWVPEDGHPGDLGHHFPEQPQLFSHQLVRVDGQAGDVSPWPCDADDESGRHGIINVRHDDRNRLGRLFSSLGYYGPHRNDHVHLETDQLGGKVREAFVLPLRPSVHKNDALIFDIADIAQPSPEDIDIGLEQRVRTGARR